MQLLGRVPEALANRLQKCQIQRILLAIIITVKVCYSFLMRVGMPGYGRTWYGTTELFGTATGAGPGTYWQPPNGSEQPGILRYDEIVSDNRFTLISELATSENDLRTISERSP